MAQVLVVNAVNSPKEIVRPRENFSSSLWGDQFMNFTLDAELKEKYLKAIQVLKDEAKKMITACGRQMVDILNLIETLERLGISYHFENEIEEKLQSFFNLDINYEDEAYDLYTVSLHFQLFRRHGYRITSDIFEKFKDGDGTFKESLKSDAKGLLSLYEATHLRMHGENILEEALSFAKANLETMAPNLSVPLKKQVEHALHQPLHFGYPRFEIYHYISIYEEEESKNESLLKFAKLDYNVVQMLHKQELCEVSRWWKELDMASKLPYARDRIVECFFWATAAFHEPRYSRGRVMVAKFIAFLSLTDDTYDSYGTTEELYAFNEAIQRWDIREVDRLPEYMKPLYIGILKLIEQFGEDLAKEGKSYALDYIIKALKELVRSHYVEAKGFIEGHLPSFDDYASNALITCAYTPIMYVALLGTKFGTKEEFEWVSKRPRMLAASLEICRFMSDIATGEDEKKRGLIYTGIEDEKKRGPIYTGIDSYMMENCVTKEEALNKFSEMATDAWKVINECSLMPFSCAKDVLLIIINISRAIEVIYKNGEDGYSRPEKGLKSFIIAMFVNPLKI